MTSKQSETSKNTRPAKFAKKQRTPGKTAAPPSAVRRSPSAPQAIAHRKVVSRPSSPAEITAPALSKKAKIEAMLKRPEGCTLAELGAATSWQEHSIRAAMTRLRKVGCTITFDRNETPTRFRIVGAA